MTIFAPRAEQPTKPGWYFARRAWAPDELLRPVEVVLDFHGLMAKSYAGRSNLDAWAFFGAVPVCVESGT